MEGGTLQQLRNLTGQRNIGLAMDVTGYVNDIEDFLEAVIRCHLVAAALHYFSMSSLSDKPHSNAFPSNYATLPTHKRKQVFQYHLALIQLQPTMGTLINYIKYSGCCSTKSPRSVNSRPRHWVGLTNSRYK